MKDSIGLYAKLRHKWHKIHLVDRCLLTIMALLMLQSAYALFAGGTTSSEGSTVDIVVRTSAAGIFGYFISANFQPRRHGATAHPDVSAVSTQNATSAAPGAVQNQIGFAPPTTDASPERIPPQSAQTMPSASVPHGKAQIRIISGIGVVSLCILLVFRNFATDHANTGAIVSQLRDFVSGCVGFLISCSTGTLDNPVDSTSP